MSLNNEAIRLAGGGILLFTFSPHLEPSKSYNYKAMKTRYGDFTCYVCRMHY